MQWMKGGDMMQACKRLLPLVAAPAIMHQQFHPLRQPRSPQFPTLNLMLFPNFTTTRFMFVNCMDEDNAAIPVPELPANHTDRDIYEALKVQYNALPDTSTATLKDIRIATAQALGLSATGLDNKAQLIKKLVSAYINEEAVTFNASGAFQELEPEPAVPVPMTSARALTASAGLRPRKLPKPIFVPFSEPRIGLEDLTVRPWHGQNPVKTVVDIILNHEEAISESQVKKCVVDSTLEELPSIARPPPGAVAVNHWTQTAFIPSAAGGNKWHIVNFITFQSEGQDGKVLPDTAKTYEHGTMHLIHYGSNNKNGKRVFLHLFHELGGFQIRQWELQCSAQSAAEAAATGDEELDAIDRGFEFIQRCWQERSVPATGIKQVQWVTRCNKDPSCPLYGQGAYKWTELKIKEALRALREEGCLAKVVKNNPYTIKTFAPWFVDEVLAHLMPMTKTKSLGLVGRSGI